MVNTDGQHQRTVHVEAFSDADWAGDKADRKSTTGYVITINGCVVSWGVKKQSAVALSTAEAEYMAVSLTIQEIIWIKQLVWNYQHYDWRKEYTTTTSICKYNYIMV